jgi:hypothetical protein
MFHQDKSGNPVPDSLKCSIATTASKTASLVASALHACRVARFFLDTMYQNGGKIYQMTTKYTK